MRNDLRRDPVRSRQRGDLLVIRGPLRPQLAQTPLLALGNGGLRHKAEEDLLAGRVDPMIRKCANDGTPDLRFALVEMGRWIGTPRSRNGGRHDAEAGLRLPTSGHLANSPARSPTPARVAPAIAGTGCELAGAEHSTNPHFAQSLTSNAAAIV